MLTKKVRKEPPFVLWEEEEEEVIKGVGTFVGYLMYFVNLNL